MDTADVRGTWVNDGYEDDRKDFNMKNSRTEYGRRHSILPVPVKSRADIILTDLEKQLEATESRYDSAKERLRYSKLLYHTAGSISLGTNDYKKTSESPISEKNSQSEISANSRSTDEKNFENNLASGDTQYLREAKNSQQRTQIEFEPPTEESPVDTTRSPKVISDSNIFHDVHDENSNDSDTQNYFSEQTRGDRKMFSYDETLENNGPDEDTEIRKDHLINDISTRRQYPHQLNLAEYSKGLQDESDQESQHEEFSKLEDPQNYSNELKSSRQQKLAKQELHLNLGESVESLQMSVKNKKSRSEKNRRVNSVVTSTNRKIIAKQIDDSISATSKKRRKKRGLKASNSRCTTATRDTIIFENKKDVRKRKQRGHSTMPGSQSSNRRHDIAAKIQENCSEFIEIYNNRAVKSGSISVVSSKHSKLMDPRGRGISTANTCDQPIRVKGSYKLVENKRDDNEERRTRKQKNNQRISSTVEHVETDDGKRSEEPIKTNLIYRAECSPDQTDNKIIEEYRNRDHNSHPHSHENSTPYYDPLAIRNYELPTVASRLKQVNRSYFNRFNFRNIPFVVGTSTTPSYNLGLNIQETLSLIKTRQIMPNGVTPLLINKVTKGVRPVSTLLGCIKDEDETQADEANIRFGVTSAGIYSVYPGQMSTGHKIPTPVQLGQFSMKTPRISCIADNQTLYEARSTFTIAKNEAALKKLKTQSICSSMKFNASKTNEVQTQLTQSTLLRQRQEELSMGDSQSMKWQSMTQNGKGIRDVLENFHDQFQAMYTKYVKLQEQFEKTKDKSLEKEMESLDKELNAKEEEINAVASLWMEVRALKQQMRMLHERNSLVCVSTESPGSPMCHQLSTQGRMANPIRMINFYKRSGSADNNRGPSTSTRLAGLLRQIKTFQKQLKSNK